MAGKVTSRQFERDLPVKTPAVLLTFLLALLFSPSLTRAQQPDPQAPVPQQILTAHTVFLASGIPDSNFPIGTAQTYQNVYQSLQAWGRYHLVPTPEQADLIFTLTSVDPSTSYISPHNRTYSYFSPAYQLTITDPHTNTPLWTIDSPVTLSGKGDTLARWETISTTNLISRLKVLSGEPLSAAEAADLTTVPKTHFGRNAAILGGAFVGIGVAGGLILHHEFENSLANQKASQDAFCAANHIPLNMCAGG